MRSARLLSVTALISLIGVQVVAAAPWPAYLGDKARSGRSSEAVKTPMYARWTFQPAIGPDPAWTEPLKETARVRFDDVFHVVAANGRVYFGSSGDNQVWALDASSGRVVWKFFADGPVRLAPTLVSDRLYFGSDDGFAYCLHADDGRLIWKVRGGDNPDRVIGHGRMMSLWPVRTGVLVDGGVAYFGAGLFPSESIYILAVHAGTGRRIWRNDDAGDRGPEQDRDGISPQGYLLANDSTLFVPSGRNMPAAFSRKTGEFLYYLGGGKSGGTYAILADENLIAGVNEQRVYDSKSGRTTKGGYAWSPANRLIVTETISYALGDHEIVALDRSRVADVDKERAAVVGQRQKLQSAVRTFYRQRYYLKKEDPDYEKKHADLSRKIDEAIAKNKKLGEQLEAIENQSFAWKRETDCRDAMILAGDVIFAGGSDRVEAVNAETGKWLWTGTVDGRASGLAFADGRLYVSTTAGTIHCFSQEKPARFGDRVRPEIKSYPFAEDEWTAVYKEAAEHIVSETGASKGFALVLGVGEGRLAFELAKRTELRIYAVDPDESKVAGARRALDAAGLYGRRVTVDTGSLHDLPYPDYFANLIVSDDLVATGQVDASAQEVYRVLRPVGGRLYLGQPGSVKAAGGKVADAEAIRTWFASADGPKPEVSTSSGTWLSVRRGALPGAGEWTHMYADPANTANSNDRRVSTPLSVLWFGRPGPERMVERHARAATPVSKDGRLFVQGENVVMAFDAYNGTQLWQRDIPGAVRVRVDVDSSNLAVTDYGLYVATRDGAYRLDPATGETIKKYDLPESDPEHRRWGVLASTDQIIFGTTAKPLLEEYGARWQNESDDPIENTHAHGRFFTAGGHWRYMQRWPDWGREDTWKGALTDRMITSSSVFALDINTGSELWKYEGKIPQTTISIADGLAYFTDMTITPEQRVAAVQERREKFGKLSFEDDQITDYNQYDVRKIVALDANTGEVRWQRTLDVTGSGGDKLGTAVYDGKLFVFGHFSNHDGSQFAKGGLAWRRITALSIEDGAPLWSKELNYLRRPLIIGKEMIVEPRAIDIDTGEFKTRVHPVTGQVVPWEFKRGGHSCGITSASADCFFLRSDSINFYDYKKDSGMLPFGGIRAGCWINMIAANGLMMMPESSAGCVCSFPIRSTVVMAPREKQRKWTVYVSPGPMTPVKNWFLNLGAPGDRKDAAGNVWFGYPQLRLGYGVRFTLDDKVSDGQGLGYFARSFEDEPIAGVDKPWVNASGVLGLQSCAIPLIAEDQKPADYTVRLGFCETDNDTAGQRVFDIKLQGKVVAADVDVFKEAGGSHKVLVRRFKGIRVTDTLDLELVPKSDTGTPAGATLLNAIEIIRDDG